MNLEKQTLLVQYLAHNADVFALCLPVVNPEYFDSKLRPAVKFIKDYYDSYHNTPDTDFIIAETGITIPKVDITRDQVSYCCTEIEQFCKQQAIKKAVLEAPQFIAQNDYSFVENIKEAILLSINRDMGQDYYGDAEERVLRLLDSDDIISTGWPNVDEQLQMRRKELHLIAANSGGGKSLTMNNMAFNMAEQGYRVLYISLEMSQDKIGQRIDSIITGINPKRYDLCAEEIVTKLKKHRLTKAPTGDLRIRRLRPGSDANTIRSYLKEYELHFNCVPDVIFVDYMGRMKAVDKSIKEEHVQDEAISDELREIGVDYNALVITATQQNRGAVEAKATDLGHAHLAGGMAKINPVDGAFSVIFTEAMKWAGEIIFKYIKTRNSDGVGKFTVLNWESEPMRISHRESNKSNIAIQGLVPDEVANPRDNKAEPAFNKKNQGKFKSLLDQEQD